MRISRGGGARRVIYDAASCQHFGCMGAALHAWALGLRLRQHLGCMGAALHAWTLGLHVCQRLGCMPSRALLSKSFAWLRSEVNPDGNGDAACARDADMGLRNHPGPHGC